MSLDVLLLVPFEPEMNLLFDEDIRRTLGAQIYLPLMEAHAELEAFVGRKIEVRPKPDGTAFGEPPITHRSLGAVALATHLERAGLDWEVSDPGVVGLGYWRRRLERARARPPKVVGISTTFIMKESWLRTICAMVRRALPDAKLVLGGYYYATSTEGFLSMDADVFCVGEGEERFPKIVKALVDGDDSSLRAIPGLYVRDGRGALHRTPSAAALDLGALPIPDWRLAERIDPPVDLSTDALMQPIETQRGCVFKCEFCTFRTLAEISVMSTDRAVAEIVGSAIAARGMVNLADATATVPHQRWEDVMRGLVARGGSPLPISAFARVTDINEERAALMARAGVRLLFIGQETADQELLNRMRKGTKVAHIRPAIETLARHGIGTYFSFIHGFPGETRASIEATRSFITNLNRGYESRPVCFAYALNPFQVYDLATVAQTPEMTDASHYLSYRTTHFTSEQVSNEVLVTMVAASKSDAAPIPMEVLNLVRLSRAALVFAGPRRYEASEWLRAVYRGIGMFVERKMDGTKLDDAALRRVRDIIVARDPSPRRLLPRLTGARATARAAFMRRLRSEWLAERERGPGALTRALLVLLLRNGTGDLSSALSTARDVLSPPPRPTPEIVQMASDLVQASVQKKKKRPRAAPAAAE